MALSTMSHVTDHTKLMINLLLDELMTFLANNHEKVRSTLSFTDIVHGNACL